MPRPVRLVARGARSNSTIRPQLKIQLRPACAPRWQGSKLIVGCSSAGRLHWVSAIGWIVKMSSDERVRRRGRDGFSVLLQDSLRQRSRLRTCPIEADSSRRRL